MCEIYVSHVRSTLLLHIHTCCSGTYCLCWKYLRKSCFRMVVRPAILQVQNSYIWAHFWVLGRARIWIEWDLQHVMASGWCKFCSLTKTAAPWGRCNKVHCQCGGSICFSIVSSFIMEAQLSKYFWIPRIFWSTCMYPEHSTCKFAIIQECGAYMVLYIRVAGIKQP